jgi:hypothetical protein
MATNILSVFNEHFLEFLNDVQTVFPDDVDILTAKNALITIKKANPKLIVKIWKTFIANKYTEEIEKGDIRFFINKDYSKDVADSGSSDQIMSSINRLREPIKNMGAENQEKAMKYIQNLTKLSHLYEN